MKTILILLMLSLTGCDNVKKIDYGSQSAMGQEQFELANHLLVYVCSRNIWHKTSSITVVNGEIYGQCIHD